MCWCSRKINKTKKAKEDIKVFKIVEPRYASEKLRMNFVPIYFKHKSYQIGQTYTESKLNVKKYKGQDLTGEPMYCIFEGLHSYTNDVKYEFDVNGGLRINNDKLVKVPNLGLDVLVRNTIDYIDSVLMPLNANLYRLDCIIPVGAEYIVNEHGEVVSNQLKPVSCERILHNIER